MPTPAYKDKILSSVYLIPTVGIFYGLSIISSEDSIDLWIVTAVAITAGQLLTNLAQTVYYIQEIGEENDAIVIDAHKDFSKDEIEIFRIPKDRVDSISFRGSSSRWRLNEVELRTISSTGKISKTMFKTSNPQTFAQLLTLLQTVVK